ncbi:Hypothetical predicted protein [Marmota monax]|uniref:Uncharacterized protein n=1 Tax=Marmota monax TaxID=9995 RepID=A0A5E4AEH7_MARMO|nr:Hypothetical predicted protein [Marmota monax]
MIARGGGKGEGQVVKGLNVSLPKPVAPARCSDAQGPGQGLRAAGISPPPLDVMELDLSPPQLSSSPEDLCPTPGTPPGTPPPQDAPLSGEVKRSQPLPIPTSRYSGAMGLGRAWGGHQHLRLPFPQLLQETPRGGAAGNLSPLHPEPLP